MIKKKTNRHYPIKWKEYYAVISPSNTLQLYPICYCNENRVSTALETNKKYKTHPPLVGTRATS
jgi:hypothetical protein